MDSHYYSDDDMEEIHFDYTLLIDHKERIWGPYNEHFQGSIARLIGLIREKPIYNARIDYIELNGPNSIYNLKVLLEVIEASYKLTNDKYGQYLTEKVTKIYNEYT